MPTKKKIFLITALLYILYTIFPLFADVSGIPIWLISIVTFVTMLSLYPKAYINKAFYWFLAYTFLLIMYFLVGRGLHIGIGSVNDSKKILIESAWILPSISIFSILCYLNDYNLTNKMVKWSIMILYISFIVTVPLMLKYNSIREALSIEQQEGFSVPGLPGYTLMHSYTIFLPALCYLFKTLQSRKKVFAFWGLMALCFVIYDTFITTSLIIMIVVVLFTLTYSKNHTSQLWIMLILLSIVIYILYRLGFFISLIDWILPAFEGTSVEYKLNDFKESMIEGQLTGDSITGRVDFHDISINSFFTNPLFGGNRSGGHSSLLDRFGGMGIVVGLPYLFMFISIMKQLNKLYITKTAKMFFYVGIIVGAVFLYNKGLFGCEGWLMYTVLMPMGILSFERIILEKKIDSHES